MSRPAHLVTAFAVLAVLSPYANGQKGWTEFAPVEGQRIVYVAESSNGGNNSTATVYTWTANPQGTGEVDWPDPFVPPVSVNAFETIDAAYGELDNGEAGWMLLRSGDQWLSDVLTPKSGPATGPGWMLIGAYSDAQSSGARPVLQRIHKTTQSALNRVAFVGLEVRGANADAIFILGRGADLLIEDVYIPPGREFGISIHNTPDPPGIENVQIRRCVIHGRWATPSGQGLADASGLHLNDIDGLLVEECVFWKNGLNETGNQGSIRNHNVYINCHNTATIFRNNISADASSHGAQVRADGLTQNNLFLRNPVNLTVGTNWEGSEGCAEPVPIYGSGAILDNVVLDSQNIPHPDPQSVQPRGLGITGEMVDTMLIEGNLLAHHTQGTQNVLAIQMQKDIIDVYIVENIVYRWAKPGVNNVGAPLQFTSRWDFSGNVVANNHFQQPSGGYVGDHHFWPVVPSEIEFIDNVYYTSQPWPFIINGIHTSYETWNTNTGEGAVPTQAYLDYPDPERNIDTYLIAAFGVTPGSDPISDFMNLAIQQSKTNWEPLLTAEQVNCYMRAGFWPDTNSCPSDIDGDGAVDVSDLLALLAAWGPCDDMCHCPGDVNRDGVIDVSDLLDLLAAWGDCPHPVGEEEVPQEILDALDDFDQTGNLSAFIDAVEAYVNTIEN